MSWDLPAYTALTDCTCDVFDTFRGLRAITGRSFLAVMVRERLRRWAGKTIGNVPNVKAGAYLGVWRFFTGGGGRTYIASQYSICAT